MQRYAVTTQKHLPPHLIQLRLCFLGPPLPPTQLLKGLPKTQRTTSTATSSSETSCCCCSSAAHELLLHRCQL